MLIHRARTVLFARQLCKIFSWSHVGRYGHVRPYFQNLDSQSTTCMVDIAPLGLLHDNPRRFICRTPSDFYNVNDEQSKVVELELEPLLIGNRRSPCPDPDIKSPNTRSINLEHLVFQLQMDMRKLKRVHLLDVEAVIHLLEGGTNWDEHNAFLLSCCGSALPGVKLARRNQLVDRLWNLITGTGRNPSAECFEALLAVYVENGHPSVDPLPIVQKMKSLGLKLSDDVYYYALMLFCQRGEVDGCKKVLTLMNDDGIVVGEKVLNALILGNSRAGDLKAAKNVLELMKSSHVDPPLETYIALIQALIEANQIEEFKNMLDLPEVRHGLAEESVFKLLKVAAMSQNPSFLNHVLDYVPSIRHNYVNLVNTVKEIASCGHIFSALTVLRKFLNTLKMQGEPVAGFFIRDIIFFDAESSVVRKVCSSLVDEDINEYAFNIATECAYRCKKFELAVELLNEMGSRGMELRSHYFLPLIVHHFDTAGVEGLIAVLDKMRSLNVTVDWYTSFNWIVPRLIETVSDPLEVARILKCSSDSSYSSGIISAILIHLIKLKRLSEASLLVKKVKGNFKEHELLLQSLFKMLIEFDERENLKTNLKLSIGILQYIKQSTPSDDKNDYIGSFLVKMHKSIGTAVPELWNAFLQDLVKADITVSDEVALLLQANSNKPVNLKIESDLNDNTKESQPLWSRKSDMDIRALECLVEELTAKSMNTRGALRSLFMKYCQSDNLQKALDIKTKFEKQSEPLTDGMKAALLGLYVRHGVLEPAKEIYNSLRNSLNKSTLEPIYVDLYKILDLATLMLEKNMIEEAISLVEKDALDCPPPLNPKSINRNVIAFLNALAKSELEQKTFIKQSRLKHIVDVFVKKSITEASNPVIGVLIRSFIERGDIETAVNEYVFYSKKYKITPSRQELTYVVLKKPDLLEKVYSAGVAVRGEIDSKHNLAFSKSDMGDLDGAAKLLTSLGNNLQFIKILKQCEYLGQRREYEKIINLAKSLKMTERNYDCSKLFNIALLSCRRFRDAEGFNRTIAVMQDEDVYIAPDFLKYKSARL